MKPCIVNLINLHWKKDFLDKDKMSKRKNKLVFRLFAPLH